MRELWLHIGAQRTATTSIQGFMRRNFEPLLEQGILYPFGIERHKPQMDALLSGALDPEAFARDLHQRADQKAHPIQKIVLSDEGVCLREDLSRLAALRAHFKVKILFSLRRQDRWLESWYFQNIKWQWNPELSNLSFEAFLQKRESFHWIHYDRYLTHLETLFGQENISLIRFERAAMPEGPVAAFGRHLGLDPALWPQQGFAPPSHDNASYSPSMAEFMRRLPIGIDTDDIRAALTDACALVDQNHLAHQGRHSDLLLPLDARREILAKYELGNIRVAQRYFGQNQLFQEPLPAPDAPLAEMRLPSDSDSLIRDYVAPLIRELVNLEALRRPLKPLASLQASNGDRPS